MHIEKKTRKINNKKLINELKRKENIGVPVERNFYNSSIDEIRAGLDLFKLVELWGIYSAEFTNIKIVSGKLLPYERLVKRFGTEIADAAIAGFQALLKRPMIQNPREIGEDCLNNRSIFWQGVILTGIELFSREDPCRVQELPDNTIKSLIASHINWSSKNRDSRWFDFLLSESPALVADALAECWDPQLAAKRPHVNGFLEFCQSSESRILARKVGMSLQQRRSMNFVFPDYSRVAKYLVLPLLQRHSSYLSIQIVHDLLTLAQKYVEKIELINLVQSELKVTINDNSKYILWLAVAWSHNPDRFTSLLGNAIGGKKETVLTLVNIRDVMVYDTLQPPQLAFLVGQIAAHISPMLRDSDMDYIDFEYEASEFVDELIDLLKENSSIESGTVLRELISSPHLSDWSEKLRNAIYIQMSIRREAEFQHLQLRQILKTLDGGHPANHLDLQSLVVEFLQDYGKEIRDGRNNGWETFWNTANTNNKLRVTTIKTEEECRDRILEWLTPRIEKFGITVAAESRYADEKRSDFDVVAGPGLKLPVEVKHHSNSSLWSSITEQLKAKYIRDPDTGNRGIYLVLWGGTKKAGIIPKVPYMRVQPESSNALCEALVAQLSPSDKQSICVLVLDISPTEKRITDVYPIGTTTTDPTC